MIKHKYVFKIDDSLKTLQYLFNEKCLLLVHTNLGIVLKIFQ